MNATLLLVEIVAALIAVALVMFVGIYVHNLSYWKRKKVVHLPNAGIPFGNMGDIFKQKETMSELIERAYNFIRANKAKHGGLHLLGKPVWMPVDLDLLNRVIIKDFSHFVNHGVYVNPRDDPISGHLFSLEDNEWKRMRAALTQAFTSGKIKMMFPIIAKTAGNLEEIIEEAQQNKESVDVKEYMARFTIDVISSTAFGLEINAIRNPESDLKKVGQRFFRNTGFEAIKLLIAFLIPKKYLIPFKFKLIKPDVSEYFMVIVKKIVDYREKNNTHRKDLMELLVQLKNSGKVVDTGETEIPISPEKKKMDMHLTVNEIAAQVFIFYIAGFETAATTSTFCLLELALNQDIQNKARAEVTKILEKHNGELTYEACMEMDYLEQVIKETMRKYPPLSLTTRICNKDYEVPGSDVVIEKNTLVVLPLIGVHHDPEIFPDPEKFNPDRFGPNSSIPKSAFLAFGEGPRICIGKLFGYIQIKVAIATVIRKHKVTLNTEKTKLPIQFEPKSFITTSKQGIYLNITEVHDQEKTS